MKVRFKKLHPDAVLPSYTIKGDAAMDLTAVGKLSTEKYIEYSLGFAVEIPENYVGLVFPRSSISKIDLMLANAVGVIDSNYRGEVTARFKSVDVCNCVYGVGDRVAQLLILPYPEIESEWCEELTKTKRDINGYGSTGR